MRHRSDFQCRRLRKVFSRSHDTVIRVYEVGNVIETQEHAGDFMES